jgi:hypothetical protein
MTTNGVNSTLEYGRELVHSGLEGARTARDNNLHGKPVYALIGESAQNSLVPAIVGAGLGLLAGLLFSKPRTAKALALGVAGAVVGVGATMAWNTRELTGDMARGAAKNISSTRNSHWLKNNPVCYG